VKKPFNPVIPDYTQKKKIEEPQARDAQKCLICSKMTLGWGMFSEGVVCSSMCNEAHMQVKSASYKGDSHAPLPN
jgi:hypothetical protein